jgi:hypothetical protein
MSEAEPADPDAPIIATISDFLDGVLKGQERDTVAAKIETDADYKRVHEELLATRKFMSGMQKAHLPATFAADVTETIHKRSLGRFFGRRTLGDKMPFGVLVVVAVLGLAVIGYLMWASETGSLKPRSDRGESAHGSAALVPHQ